MKGFQISRNIIPALGKATYAVVGEAPTKAEAIGGQIYSSSKGQFLNAVLKAADINPKEVLYTNSTLCAPTSQVPSQGDLACCRNNLISTLKSAGVKVIIALGSTSVNTLLSEANQITSIRGIPKWLDELNAYVIPTYAPGGILRNPAWFNDFANDIQKAVKALDYPVGGLKPPELILKAFWDPSQKEEALIECRKLAQGVYDRIYSSDIETDGFDYFEQDVVDIGFGISETEQVVFTRPLINDPDIQNAINEIFLNKEINIGFQNGKFDVQYLKADPDPKIFGKKKNCVIPDARNDFDTMLAHYEIDERQQTHGLKVWSREFFNAPDWEGDIKKYLPTKDTPYGNIPREVRHRYLQYDLYYTRLGMIHFPKLMQKEDTERCFRDVLMPASNALTGIELRGVQLDVKRMQAMYDEALPQIESGRAALEQAAKDVGWDPNKYAFAKMEEKMSKWVKENAHLPEDKRKKKPGATEVPKAFNPKSHPQMSYVAYDLCKLPLFEGKKTCNKDAVEVYQHRHPFWKSFAEYKDLTDLFGIYIQGMLQRVDKDGRIRPDFFLTGTVTGRISCHDPNLQNLPRKSIVKDFFIANNKSLEAFDPEKEETVIVNCDYKTLEVVVAAILSDDPVMQAPFIRGEDYHTNTCKGVFGEQIKMLKLKAIEKDGPAFTRFVENPMYMEIRAKVHEMVESMDCDYDKIADYIIDYMRFLTKFITFGIMYGRKAPSLAYGELNCSVSEAQKYIDNFLLTYKDFYKWQLRMQAKAKDEGFVQTVFGHKRRWGFITDDTLYLMKNQAVNTPIQGSAAQFCLQKIGELYDTLNTCGWGWILFTVHDSIVFEIKAKYLQPALSLIQGVMTTSPFESKVPFNIDAEVGATYKRVEGVTFDTELKKWVPSKPTKASQWLKDTLEGTN